VRILHLVTLVSPDGAFGGPIRVALNQAAELRRRGHDVHLAAGWRSQGSPPSTLDGTPTRLFRAFELIPPMGFSGMVSPRLLLWLMRNIGDYDVVHVHAGRDLISTTSLALAWVKQRPYVAQTHGMVQPDPRLKARMIDAAAVRRLLRAARTRFVLTKHEEDGLQEVLGSLMTCEQLPNGVPEQADPPDVVKGGREVLFCARLHERKRPVAFVEMAAELVRRGVAATFAILGPNDGELAAVRKSISRQGLEEIVRYDGALDYHAVPARMRQADIYVLPSVHEPFPMSLLEALALGLPSVCTDTCGISRPLRDYGAAIVTDGSVAAMADAVQAILEGPALRSELSRNARKVVAEIFSMEAVGTRLEQTYRAVVDATCGRSVTGERFRRSSRRVSRPECRCETDPDRPLDR
jgi:glycosyltransferase involved in cell wall biosynthesis